MSTWQATVAPADGAPRDDDVQQGRTEARPSHALDPWFLRSVSLDLLGRSPFRAEMAEWHGGSLRDWLDVQVAGRELWEHWLEEQLYYFFLIDNFRPESERVRALPRKLQDGRLSVQDAVHRICLSPSFEMRNPGADTFVTVVMEQVTGMNVQKNRRELEIGKSIYDGGEGLFLGRQGSTQADVVRNAMESKRFSQHFLAREYERLLRREPGKKDLTGWARDLRKDPFRYTEILREWMLSPEYALRLAEPAMMPNRLFVRALYVDLFDRLPAPEEVETLRNALDGLADSAPLRSIVVRLLLDSGTVTLPEKASIEDPTAWIRDLFVRFLGREATADELRVFVGTFREEACQPATIVYALLSHPEYHRY